MNTIRSILAATLTGLLLVPNLAHPEDIDLYTGASSGGDANVLIVLDNESNWARRWTATPRPMPIPSPTAAANTGSYFCAQKYALIKLLDKTDAVTGTYFVGPQCRHRPDDVRQRANKGGYIRFGVRKMTAINRAALIKLLKTCPSPTRAAATRTSAT